MSSTLILLPGLDGTGVLFEDFVSALPEGLDARIVRYPGDAALSHYELIHLIREEVSFEKRFFVLGESFSGPLALEIAEAEPRVLGVILVASFVANPLRYVPAFLASCVRPFMFRIFPAFARTKALLGGYSSPKLRNALRRAHGMVQPSVLAERARQVLRADARRALETCGVPVLYVEGTRDGVVRPHNLDQIRSLNPDVRVASIPAPHLVLQVAPRQAAEEIAKFIRNVSARDE